MTDTKNERSSECARLCEHWKRHIPAIGSSTIIPITILLTEANRVLRAAIGLDQQRGPTKFAAEPEDGGISAVISV